MRVSRTYLVAGGSVFALVIMGLVLWLAWPALDEHGVLLPDGTALHFEGATFGKEHAVSISPAGSTPSAPVKAQTTTPTESLVVWFSEPATKSGENASTSKKAAQVFPVLVDSHGWVVTSSSSEIRKLEGGRAVRRWVFEAFQRRDPILHLRFMDGDKLIRELEIPNPVRGPAQDPMWQVETCPITKTDGDVAVTLEKLTSFVSESKSATCRAECEVKQGGEATTAWEPVMVKVADATGNVRGGSQGGSPFGLFQLRGAIQSFAIPALSWEEPAWKISMEFSQTADSRFPAGDLWRAPRIAVPKDNEINRVTAEGSVGGAKLELLGLAGNGKISWEEGVESTNYQPCVRLRVLGARGARVTLQATNERGELIGVESTQYHDIPDKDECLCDFLLTVLTGTAWVDCTFAVHKSRFFDFVLKPPAPQAPPKTGRGRREMPGRSE